MITEIGIHNVIDMEMTMGPLPEPAPHCHALNITVRATGVSGEVEIQKITLFVWKLAAQTQLADKVEAFNTPCFTAADLSKYAEEESND